MHSGVRSARLDEAFATVGAERDMVWFGLCSHGRFVRAEIIVKHGVETRLAIGY